MNQITSSSSRRALIIFVILAILFCAQMAWWIIFQYRSAGSARRFFSEILEEQRRQTISLLNTRLSAAGRSLEDSSLEHSGVRYDISDIITGIVPAENLVRADLTDSLFLIREKDGAKFYIFLNRNYPQTMIAGDSRLQYAPPSGEVLRLDWVTMEHIEVKPESYSEIDAERERHTRMFLMEGSFFLVLIVIGGYMILLSLKRLKQTREEQLLFIHSITHELKIPLTSMNLFLDTMKRRNFEPKLVSELAPKMKEDLVRLNQLIDNILQVRRLADRQMQIRMERVDLSAEIRQFCERIRERIEAAGGRLKIDVADNIRIDAALPELMRVWELLIDNSLKYAQSVALEINITLKNTRDFAEIIFRDNGPGIPSGMEEKLFEPFYRGKIEEKRTVPGSGLGLYIAREFIRRQGGTINIRNGSTGGAVVTMKFKVTP